MPLGSLGVGAVSEPAPSPHTSISHCHVIQMHPGAWPLAWSLGLITEKGLSQVTSQSHVPPKGTMGERQTPQAQEASGQGAADSCRVHSWEISPTSGPTSCDASASLRLAAWD